MTGKSCPATTRSPVPGPMLPYPAGKRCYVVGPVLLTNAAVASARVIRDPVTASQWVVLIAWKHGAVADATLAKPLSFAVVVDGVVQWSASMPPGSTARELEIIAGRKRGDAVDIAASIMGIDPSRVAVAEHGAKRAMPRAAESGSLLA